MKKLLGVLITLSLPISVTVYVSGGSVAGAAFSGGSFRGDSNTPIRIGLFTPKSTAATAADGQSTRQSAELVAKIISDAGGINGRKLELAAYDDGLGNTQAANIVEELSTADKVDVAVSGFYSDPTRIATLIFQDTGIMMIVAYVIHPDVVNAGDFVLPQSFLGSVQRTAGAKFAVESLKVKKIAIIGMDLGFGRGLSKYFKSYTEANGIKIASEDYVAMSDNDFTPIIPKIKSLNVDMIHSADYYMHASEVIWQAALQDLRVPVLDTEGADSWQLLRTAGRYTNGLYIITNMNRDDKLESTQKHIEEYEATYKMQPDVVDASVYDAFQVLFAGLESVGTGDSAALHDYVGSMRDLEMATGKLLYYTKSRSAVRTIQIQQAQEGAFHGFVVIDNSKIIDPTNY